MRLNFWIVEDTKLKNLTSINGSELRKATKMQCCIINLINSINQLPVYVSYITIYPKTTVAKILCSIFESVKKNASVSSIKSKLINIRLSYLCVNMNLAIVKLFQDCSDHVIDTGLYSVEAQFLGNWISTFLCSHIFYCEIQSKFA